MHLLTYNATYHSGTETINPISSGAAGKQTAVNEITIYTSCRRNAWFVEWSCAELHHLVRAGNCWQHSWLTAVNAICFANSFNCFVNCDCFKGWTFTCNGGSVIIINDFPLTYQCLLNNDCLYRLHSMSIAILPIWLKMAIMQPI